MTPTGLEQTAKTPGKTAIAEESVAESGAFDRSFALSDPDLKALIDAWPGLSDDDKRAILEIVNSGCEVA